MNNLPNPTIMNEAAREMTDDVQSFSSHQQRLTGELLLAANFPVVEMQTSINEMRAVLEQGLLSLHNGQQEIVNEIRQLKDLSNAR